MASQTTSSDDKTIDPKARYLRDPKPAQPAPRPQSAKDIPAAPVVFSDWASI